MANEKDKVDRFVLKLCESAGIHLEMQKSSIKELDDALTGHNADNFGASKKMNGQKGSPDFIGVVKDFVIVVEDKDSSNTAFKHDIRDKNGVLIIDRQDALEKGAMNGALWYAKHIIKYTFFKKVIAVGVYGNEKVHQITPIFVDNSPTYKELENIESFEFFSKDNIDEFYTRIVLNEDTNIEKDTREILEDASRLHQALYEYGNIQSKDKPLIVSGILLALKGIEDGYFDIDKLTGDRKKTDGKKIYDAVVDVLQAADISPETKRDKLLAQFAVIRDTPIINEVNETLGKTPLKYFTEFLHQHIFKAIRYSTSTEDYLGRFYGEFMSYGDNDGQTLGIVLTPKHITELFCDLLQVAPSDGEDVSGDEMNVILDSTCGTGGFIIAGMHKEFQYIIKKKGLKSQKEIESDPDIIAIRERNLHGFELQPYMFTIATTNMILRGDGKSNLHNEDFLKQNAAQIRKDIRPTIGMMNPPYSQGSKEKPNLYEMSFTKHLLDCMVKGGRAAVIVPQSSMTGKTREEQNIKKNILENHTLEGVITCNKDTFYGVGVHPVIAVFTAGRPHPADKEVKFINFEDDGYKVRQHIGLLETPSAKDKKQHLLDVWFGNLEADTKFCVKSTTTYKDEWLHSYFYFNDEQPTESDIETVIGNYLTFQFRMVMEGREWLFKEKEYTVSFYMKDKNHTRMEFEVTAMNRNEAKGKAIEALYDEYPDISSDIDENEGFRYSMRLPEE